MRLINVGRVLRMTEGEQIDYLTEVIIYPSKIIEASKKPLKWRFWDVNGSDKESNLSIHLGQVISRGDRMEFTIQKS